jgi:hypothetical protein
MSELRIERLRLRVVHGAGHEHRLEPIARLAATLLAERLASGPEAVRSHAGHLRAAPVSLGLAGSSDHAVARRIASAWLAALASGPARADT